MLVHDVYQHDSVHKRRPKIAVFSVTNPAGCDGKIVENWFMYQHDSVHKRGPKIAVFSVTNPAGYDG